MTEQQKFEADFPAWRLEITAANLPLVQNYCTQKATGEVPNKESIGLYLSHNPKGVKFGPKETPKTITDDQFVKYVLG